MIFQPFLCQSLNSSGADSGAQRDNLVTFVQGFPFLGPLVESHTVRTEPGPHHDAQWGPKGRWDSSEEMKTLPNKAVRHCSRMVGWVGGGGGAGHNEGTVWNLGLVVDCACPAQSGSGGLKLRCSCWRPTFNGVLM